MPCGALDWILGKKRASVGKLGTPKLKLQSGTLEWFADPSSGDLLGIEPRSLVSLVFAGGFFEISGTSKAPKL